MHCITYIFYLILIINSVLSPSACLSTDTICSTTLYPSFCKSILPPNNSTSIHENSRFFIQKSISSSQDFLLLLDNYLKHHKNLPKYTTHALEDCKHLTIRNLDFLSEISQTIRSTNQLHSSIAQDVHTLLSAVVTNQHTCLDGLKLVTSPSNINSTFETPLSNVRMLHSISLKLFVNGYVRDTKPTFWAADYYQKFRNLYSIGVNATVSKMVVVDPSGKGDFRTISDAVTSAPSNSDGSKGYFVIYVKAGVYEEYVKIDVTKKYLMVVGEGIGKTIISGNHNYVDGWSTFDSATFGKLFQ